MNGRLAIAGALGAVLATLGATSCVVLSAFLGVPALAGGAAALVGGLVLGALGTGISALVPLPARPLPEAPNLKPVVEALARLAEGRGSKVELSASDGPPELVKAVHELASSLKEARTAAVARETELRDVAGRDAALVRHLEAELDLVENRERASNAVRDAFLSRMSHELRTPLNAILGYVEMLSEEVEDEEHKADLGRVRSSARNLLAIVTTVLDLTQLQAGSYAIQPEAIDLAAMAAQVVDSVRIEAEANGNQLEVDIEPGTEIHLDRRMLQSILFNLMSNGCKYTTNGTVRLRAGLDHGRLELIVSDTGIGMTQRQIEEAFRPFNQADEGTTRRYDGAGLGLAVVRGFAEAMQGVVQIESRLGQGATVRVDLPSRCLARAPGHEMEEDEPTMLLR